MTLKMDEQAHQARLPVVPGPVTHGTTPLEHPGRTHFLQTVANAAGAYAADPRVAAEEAGGADCAGKVTPGEIRLNILTAINVLCDVRSRADDREVNGRASGLDDSTVTKVTLASAAAHLAIEHLYLSPVDTVTLEMNAEFITLAGEVSCAGDRLAVEVAVTYLAENLSVNNKIRVSERTCERASEVPSRLGEALPMAPRTRVRRWFRR